MISNFDKDHLIGELVTHRGFRLLLEQLEAEFSSIETKLADSADERVDTSLLAQWKVTRKLLRKLKSIPEQAAERTRVSK